MDYHNIGGLGRVRADHLPFNFTEMKAVCVFPTFRGKPLGKPNEASEGWFEKKDAFWVVDGRHGLRLCEGATPYRHGGGGRDELLACMTVHGSLVSIRLAEQVTPIDFANRDSHLAITRIEGEFNDVGHTFKGDTNKISFQ